MRLKIYIRRKVYYFPIDISKGIFFYAPTEGCIEKHARSIHRIGNARVKIFFPEEKLDEVLLVLTEIDKRYYDVDVEKSTLYLRVDSGIKGIRNPSEFSIIS